MAAVLDGQRTGSLGCPTEVAESRLEETRWTERSRKKLLDDLLTIDGALVAVDPRGVVGEMHVSRSTVADPGDRWIGIESGDRRVHLDGGGVAAV